jgi:hypothetical protein
MIYIKIFKRFGENNRLKEDGSYELKKKLGNCGNLMRNAVREC